MGSDAHYTDAQLLTIALAELASALGVQLPPWLSDECLALGIIDADGKVLA